MQLEYDKIMYSTVRASDLERGGMSLELNRAGKTVAEVFHSDQTAKFTVTLFSEDLPLDVLEKYFEEAHIRLPAMNS